MNRCAYQQNFFISLAVLGVGLLLFAFAGTSSEGLAVPIWESTSSPTTGSESVAVPPTAATSQPSPSSQSSASPEAWSDQANDASGVAAALSGTNDDAITLASKGQQATVTRVIDGDTIVISTGQTVRYIGIDTPETSGDRPECYSREAARRNQELVLGKTVILARDVSDTDRYGRLLRLVFVGDELVNATLVREGYARVATYLPDVGRSSELRSAEAEARKAGLGLWGSCSTANEARPTVDSTIPQATRTDCPIDTPIKGNAQSHIYHLPGQKYYDITQPEACFATEEAARAAGYRKAKL